MLLNRRDARQKAKYRRAMTLEELRTYDDRHFEMFVS